MTILTADQAQAVLDAARAEARAIGSPSSIAIVDHGRELLAFARMDGALLASPPIAQAKAYTAKSMDCATKDLESLSQPGAPLFGLHHAHSAVGRTLVTFGGGVPIATAGGEVIGAIGVAGGSPDQDHQIAAAGAAAVHAASAGQ